MEMGAILILIIIGAIVGLLARFFLPGKQAIGMVATVIIGIIGTLIGDWIGKKISPSGGTHWILSVLVSVVLVAGYVGMGRRRTV
jgi:uncharacterized membrane protein YeaQ/YmgE (transglycosylase-associated protein family)